ncbi:hypothetical protein BC629DRAFT_694179 [Irpex lacteus]|nr:hypothetical protein BC629DRAFT_694179 [Irpex lacteus]
MPSDSAEASKPEVRYVLSGQPTGWAAMGKEVREFDEEKVRNSKEDIDTLLVFAGLFSAVLSAFLVAAYPSLQLDRMDTVVYTLQVIAAQTAGYNLIGNTITSSTAPPPPLPPFKPAPNDIRVNVLWFASLVISLITASFAMLVKQWLREFLAVDVPSPQARLRIRHFREPQLKQWMVFEIGASLPLLLQLSLGLFFVGLCYFTAAIHASIAYTTLPLVVGWALFFFTATALPIFFPRCPYRTTILKVVVTRLHRRIKLIVRWAHSPRSQGRSPTPVSSSLLSRLYHVWSSRASLLRRVLQCTLPLENSLPDEREIVKTQDQDVNILISVDALQANDELLLTAMTEAFHYGRPDWTDAVHFVMQILAHRLPTVAEADRVLLQWPFADAFPLRNLRPQVVEGISKILSEHVAYIPGNYKTISPVDPQRATDPHFLCMYSLIIAVADVDIKLVTSNPVLLQYFEDRFAWIEVEEPLCKDWIRIATMGKQTPQTSRSTSIMTKPVGRMLRLMVKVVEPAKISLSNGVRFVEALTATKIDDWGQTTKWNALPMDADDLSRYPPSEAFLQALLLSEFKLQVSADLKVVSPDETGRVLSIILRSMLRRPEVIRNLMMRCSMSIRKLRRRYFGLTDSIPWLSRIRRPGWSSKLHHPR